MSHSSRQKEATGTGLSKKHKRRQAIVSLRFGGGPKGSQIIITKPRRKETNCDPVAQVTG
jgi:hypothetical protein